ncbi:MAG: hypothetical protein H5T68_03990 [Chloroflexi bacterium]|nr:hypothetical protein [Chloroflexota bacterium]
MARAQGPLYPLPTARFGVDMVKKFGLITDYDVASLHLAWYSDWGTSLNPLRPGGIEYAQLIGVRNGVISPPLDQLGPMIDANPGYLWIIGNEPECIWQDNCTPEQYAAVYHQLYTFIKGRDPTAQVAIGGVVQPTPLRLKWLDRVLDYYQATYGEPMPVDVWNIHNMILQELKGSWGCEIPRGLTETSGRLYTVQDNDNINYFVQHIVDFRTWMRDRGQRDKPLFITEYGVLMPVQYGFTPERVNAYMDATFDYLMTARDPDLGYPADGNRLVQRWLWNSLNDQPWDPSTGEGFNGALFDYRYPVYPGVITPMGINFREYTEALVAGQVCLTGGISLKGRAIKPDPSYAITVTVTLYPVGGGDPDVRTARTDATGHFGLCHLSPGTYDIVAKGYNTLTKRVNGVQVTDDTPIIEFGLLTPGDANDDNCIGILDYSILAAAYGKCVGTPDFDARADFSGDRCIGILDYSMLATHYSECGVP